MEPKHQLTAALATSLCLLLAPTACGGGTPTSAQTSPQPSPIPTPAPTPSPPPRPSPDPAALAAIFEGTYSGAWKNTTLASTGSVQADVHVDRAAGSVSVTLALGGNVFGGGAPAPETFTNKLSDLGSSYSGKSAIFGDVTATLDLNAFRVKGENVPNPRVARIEASGTLTDPRSISFAYQVFFKDGTTAEGTVSLLKSGQ